MAEIVLRKRKGRAEEVFRFTYRGAGDECESGRPRREARAGSTGAGSAIVCQARQLRK